MQSIQKRLRRHFLYYLSLVLIQLVGLLVTYFSAYDLRLQFTVIVLVTFVYNGWALLHHHLEHDLTAKIVVEYVLMGCLGILIAYILLFH